MLLDFSQLCATYACEGWTRGATDKDVDGTIGFLITKINH